MMRAPGILNLFVFLALIACGDDATDPVVPPADEIPPAAVSDLEIQETTATTVELMWTAPGNDGLDGVAWRYDIRYATDPITPENWGAAHQVGGEPPPGFPGWVQLFEIINLQPGRTYYFGLETYDHDQNRSALSNIVSATPGLVLDSDPPGSIDDLSVLEVSSSSVTLTWTAPGDDGDIGTVLGYIVRYASFPLDESNFGTGTLVAWTPIPHPAGQPEQLVVDGLSAASTYYFATRAVDDAGNLSSLSNLATAITSGGGLGKGAVR